MAATSLQPNRPLPQAKYEMNLAEFPISVLSKRIPQGQRSIEYTDTIIGKDGTVVPRRWKISPSSSEYGFGSSGMIGTLFELFQIWKESEFRTRNIPFGSIYNLVKRLGLKDAAPNYGRIRKDLNALLGILIEAKNAFWDNEKKAYVDKTFHLFESMTSYHEGPEGQQPLPLASLKASEELWGSIQANAIINAGISREWFHSLSPGEQRLSLYLSKMLHAQPVHKREIAKLGEQLPLLAKTRKKVKQQLGIYSQGLLDKGHPLLASFHYESRQRGEGDVIVFVRKKTKNTNDDDAGTHGSHVEEGRGEQTPLSGSRAEEAHELVAYFYKIFHGLKPERISPQKKELAQAQELITMHGGARARHIVDFSQRVAPETNYQPQTFGGIVSYTARALADYDRQTKTKARQEQEQAKEEKRGWREREERQRGDELLAQLSLEEREQLFAEVRAELLAKDPFTRKNPDGPLAQSLIRDAVLKKLKGKII